MESVHGLFPVGPQAAAQIRLDSAGLVAEKLVKVRVFGFAGRGFGNDRSIFAEAGPRPGNLQHFGHPKLNKVPQRLLDREVHLHPERTPRRKCLRNALRAA